MQCLRDSGFESGACRERAMAYLQCRMDRQVAAGGRAVLRARAARARTQLCLPRAAARAACGEAGRRVGRAEGR